MKKRGHDLEFDRLLDREPRAAENRGQRAMAVQSPAWPAKAGSPVPGSGGSAGERRIPPREPKEQRLSVLRACERDAEWVRDDR